MPRKSRGVFSPFNIPQDKKNEKSFCREKGSNLQVWRRYQDWIGKSTGFPVLFWRRPEVGVHTPVQAPERTPSFWIGQQAFWSRLSVSFLVIWDAELQIKCIFFQQRDVPLIFQSGSGDNVITFLIFPGRRIFIQPRGNVLSPGILSYYNSRHIRTAELILKDICHIIRAKRKSPAPVRFPHTAGTPFFVLQNSLQAVPETGFREPDTAGGYWNAGSEAVQNVAGKYNKK